jgi:hypothetical protein
MIWQKIARHLELFFIQSLHICRSQLVLPDHSEPNYYVIYTVTDAIFFSQLTSVWLKAINIILCFDFMCILLPKMLTRHYLALSLSQQLPTASYLSDI